MKREMTNLERFVCAIERGEPDRVPIYEGSINPKVVEGILPGGTYYDLVEHLDLDMCRAGEIDSREWIDEGRRRYRNQWGVVCELNDELFDFPMEGPIKSMSDLKSYTPPDPDRAGALGDLPLVVERFKGKRMVIWKAMDGYMPASFLRGMEEFLMDYVLDPDLAHALMEMTCAYFVRLVERAAAAGADAMVLLDDYADKNAPMMSPAHFREFILPYLTRIVHRAAELGLKTIKHTDGNIWSILDMIVGTGIDAINPLEPVAGMDIGRVKKEYGDRVCIIGNIDCGDVLVRYPPERVSEVVRETIRVAAPGGGYIISSSNSIQSTTPPENYVALVETTKEFGRYPISA